MCARAVGITGLFEGEPTRISNPQTNMNKQQRDYTIDRINKIAKGKEFECECEKPSRVKHIRRAIAQGTAKVKSAKEIFRHFEKDIIENGSRYNDPTAGLADLFEEPQSYKEAMAELAAEQKKHEDANNEVKRFAQSLIDRVELGEFDDGKEPIRLMEAYAPKAPKPAKAR